MRYSLYLFAHDGAAFAERLRRRPEKVVARVGAWAAAAGVRGRRLDRGMKYVREYCAGELGKTQRAGHFEALCWVGNALMEPISIPEYSELKRYGTFIEYGIVPGLVRHPAPYPLPRAKEPPPLAGYLPRTALAAFEFADRTEDERLAEEVLRAGVDAVFSDLARQLLGTDLAPPPRPHLSPDQIRYAREEFSFVLESVAGDNLDLLAVIG